MANDSPAFRHSTRGRVPPAIALIGFMGAGKTTVGQGLSERLGWQFLDLDSVIQTRTGRTIQSIFQESGEAAFRHLERQALEETVRDLPLSGTVLSLGGGAFIGNTNRQLLRENGIPAVFLDAPAEELFRRCSQPGVVRPLLGDRDRFGALYEERKPAYLMAAVCIQTGGKEIASVVEEIAWALGLEASLKQRGIGEST